MRYVLFVCAHNAGRSQMAQAFFERHAPADLRAESARQAPADAIWPNVVEAMGEVSIDISGRKPKKIDREMQLHADKAITLNCQESCPYLVGGVEDWEVDDPAGQPLEVVREIRDEIERRVRELVEDRVEEIRGRSKRPSATARSASPVARRAVRGDQVPGGDPCCADAILGRYADAPVRSFVLTLAHREAVECLRAERCYAVT